MFKTPAPTVELQIDLESHQSPEATLQGRNRMQAWSIAMAAVSSIVLALGVNQLAQSKPGQVPEDEPAHAVEAGSAPETLSAPAAATARGAIARGKSEVARRTMKSLLVQAHADIDALRLTQPDGNNARERFASVLRFDPDNVAARVGLYRVVGRYRQLAESATAAGRASRADGYLRKARAVLSGSLNCGQYRRLLSYTLADVLRECS